eukprot:COSAG01_NODE_830_length_13271_cov_2.845278_5_plen_797_part_01
MHHAPIAPMMGGAALPTAQAKEQARKQARDNPRWEASDVCMHCGVEFTFGTRKHHCRYCGFALCSKCSSQKLRLDRWIEEDGRVVESEESPDTREPRRVCYHCHDHAPGQMAHRAQARSQFDAAAGAVQPDVAREAGPPSVTCWKKKTDWGFIDGAAGWAERFIQLEDGTASNYGVMVYDSRMDTVPRGSSLRDVRGCEVRIHLKTLRRMGSQLPVLTLSKRGGIPTRRAREKDEVSFCFRDAAAMLPVKAALKNLTEARAWNVDQPDTIVSPTTDTGVAGAPQFQPCSGIFQCKYEGRGNVRQVIVELWQSSICITELTPNELPQTAKFLGSPAGVKYKIVETDRDMSNSNQFGIEFELQCPGGCTGTHYFVLAAPSAAQSSLWERKLQEVASIGRQGPSNLLPEGIPGATKPEYARPPHVAKGDVKMTHAHGGKPKYVVGVKFQGWDWTFETDCDALTVVAQALQNEQTHPGDHAQDPLLNGVEGCMRTLRENSGKLTAVEVLVNYMLKYVFSPSRFEREDVCGCSRIQLLRMIHVPEKVWFQLYTTRDIRGSARHDMIHAWMYGPYVYNPGLALPQSDIIFHQVYVQLDATGAAEIIEATEPRRSAAALSEVDAFEPEPEMEEQPEPEPDHGARPQQEVRRVGFRPPSQDMAFRVHTSRVVGGITIRSIAPVTDPHTVYLLPIDYSTGTSKPGAEIRAYQTDSSDTPDTRASVTNDTTDGITVCLLDSDGVRRCLVPVEPTAHGLRQQIEWVYTIRRLAGGSTKHPWPSLPAELCNRDGIPALLYAALFEEKNA